MKNYRITLNGERYTLPGALTAADKTWDGDLEIHTCNGLKTLTVYEYKDDELIRTLTVQQAINIINKQSTVLVLLKGIRQSFERL